MPAPSLPIPKTERPRGGVILVNNVHEHLKREILNGRLRPGVKLTHQGIAETLNVSRTPVREALERLHQEGFVTREPRRGYFVGEVQNADVVEFYGAREALELYALGVTLDRGPTAAEITRLRTINRRYEDLIRRELTHERLMVDRQFHLELARLCGNGFLVRSLDSIFERVILKRRLERVTDTRGDQPFHAHRALIEALSEGDRARASTVLRDHIQDACERLLRHIHSFDAGEGMPRAASRGRSQRRAAPL